MRHRAMHIVGSREIRLVCWRVMFPHNEVIIATGVLTYTDAVDWEADDLTRHRQRWLGVNVPDFVIGEFGPERHTWQS